MVDTRLMLRMMARSASVVGCGEVDKKGKSLGQQVEQPLWLRRGLEAETEQQILEMVRERK